MEGVVGLDHDNNSNIVTQQINVIHILQSYRKSQLTNVYYLSHFKYPASDFDNL